MHAWLILFNATFSLTNKVYVLLYSGSDHALNPDKDYVHTIGDRFFPFEPEIG